VRQRTGTALARRPLRQRSTAWVTLPQPQEAALSGRAARPRGAGRALREARRFLGRTAQAQWLIRREHTRGLGEPVIDAKYSFHVGPIESVGWQLADKGGKARVPARPE